MEFARLTPAPTPDPLRRDRERERTMGSDHEGQPNADSPRSAAKGSPRKSSLPLFAVMAMGSIVTVAIVLIVMRGPKQIDGQNFDAKMRRGIAALENQDLMVPGTTKQGYDVAEEIFSELRAEYPGELSVIRNLAVLRTLRYEDARVASEKWDEATRREYLATTAEILKELAALPGQEPIANYLQARLLLKDSGTLPTEEVVSLLGSAAEKKPDELAFWGRTVAALSIVIEDEQTSDAWKQLMSKALEKSIELDSQNVYLLVMRLMDQVLMKDVAAKETVEKLIRVVEPLERALVANNANNSPVTLLGQVKAAIEQGDWDEAIFRASRARESLKNKELNVFTSDLARAEGHPLDFVMSKPTPELEQRFSTSEPAVSPSLQATFDAPQTLIPATPNAIGLSACDVDLDKDIDLVVLTSDRLVMHLRNEEGGFTESLELALPAGFEPRGMVSFDVDMDDLAKLAGEGEGPAMSGGMGEASMGEDSSKPRPANVYFEADPDFVVWGKGGVLVVLNADDKGTNRHLELLDQTRVAAVSEVVDVAAFDLDHDSDTDLVVGTSTGAKIWLNNGRGSFADLTEFSSLETTSWREGLQAFDWDRDLDIDVIGCDGEQVYLLENVLYGRFRQRKLEELGSRSKVERVLVLEADGEPSWDVMLRQSGAGQVALTRTTPEGVTITRQSDSLANLEEGAIAEDLDNDGVQDLIGIFNGRVEVAMGVPSGGFMRAVPASDAASAFEIIDWDNDGRLDLLVAGAEGVEFRRNTTSSGNQWWMVQCVGAEDNSGRVTRDGIGTLVELVSGGRYQAKVVRGQRTHLGLGNSGNVGVARLIWSNGMPQGILDPKNNTTHAELVYLKGSCPFLYTWDGEKFVFVTDCLWAAPVGLPASRTELIPSREWEYIKVPGELLKRDEQGLYRIMLTEELWESAYFDHVQLIAVDHPENVRIETNEKVGPPFIAEYKIHTVTNPVQPLGAWNPRGEEVSPVIATADGDFYRGFEQRFVQGLTEEHYIELDLGDLSQAKNVTLFLTGWLRPTDSSLNVSFTDHPTRDAPMPPTVFVRNEAGEWVASEVPMGFPGGKTKTIAVDLSHLMPRADGRIRIVTTAEVYWDEVFFTVDEPQVELQTTRLNVASAELEYRGFSAREPVRPHSPERFDYSVVEAGPWWPPMRGRFTSYGPVTSLLTAQDHQMVVMGSGDQMAVVFEPLASDPPEGWTRDYLLYSVGWDKDADLNTRHGQYTEPLPFAGMTDYPYGPDDMNWSTPELQEYQENYLQRSSRWYEFWTAPFRTIELDSPYKHD